MSAHIGSSFCNFLICVMLPLTATAHRTGRLEILRRQGENADIDMDDQVGYIRIGNGMDDSDTDDADLEKKNEGEEDGEYIAFGRRSFSPAGAEATEDPAIFNFNGVYYSANKKADMLITRQGATYFEGKARNLPFQRSSLYKEYVVQMNNAVKKDMALDKKQDVAQCSQPVFVKAEAVPGTCGIGVFTQRARTCDPLSAEAVEQEWELLKRFTPPTSRGFGIEFEFVARNPNDQQYKELVKDLQTNYEEDEVQEHLDSESGGVHGVHLCFKEVVDRPGRLSAKKSCAKNSECAIAEYCMDCKKCLGKDGEALCGMCTDEDDAVCYPAIECDRERAPPREGNPCPVPISKWNWEVDKSVVPLSEEEAAEVDGTDETNGTAFEVTAPGPPHVLGGESGWHSVVQMLSSMRHMGIQAGPSAGIHVHVNVLSDKAPGTRLTYPQIATVWAAYAKYQLVIDEMFTPNRVPNHFANSLFLGDCKAKRDKGKCSSDPCGCNKRIFKQMHQYVQTKGSGGKARTFCNKVVEMEGSKKACTWRHPHQRYSQLNLVPMHRFGTIEFRAHSTTYDAERVGRWIQFLIAFVEYFGTGPGHVEMKYFFESRWPDDYERLAQLQREVTTADLFKDMKKTMPTEQEYAMEDTMQYFLHRKWEGADRACQPTPDQSAATFAGKCTTDNTDFTAAFLEKEQESGQEMLLVQVPPFEFRYSVHNLDVMMPSGQPWKVRLVLEGGTPTWAELPTRRRVPITRTGGTYEFRFVIEMADKLRELEADIAETHRCCCGIDGSCKWFNEDLQVDGRCPYLYSKGESERFCASTHLMKWDTDQGNFLLNMRANALYAKRKFGCKIGGNNCQKTWHSRRRHRTKHQCLITSEPHAYWSGPKCE